MSNPLRTDAHHGPDDGALIDRDARIEQLLLAGLDHYFAGSYEQAINVWTRVVFLERGHSRARAYIERARGAMAEQQRESEELLHLGVEAFNKGDIDNARDLITRAIDQIGPTDLAMAFLDRLNRLGPAASNPTARRVVIAETVRRGRRHETPAVEPRRYGLWQIAGVVLVAGTVAFMLAGVGLDTWFADGLAARRAGVQVLRNEPLPVMRPADLAMTRARRLYGDGHLRDALDGLDGIGLADPLRAEADALRADIQRRLLEGARPAPAFSVPAGPR